MNQPQHFVRQTRNTSYVAYESQPSKKPVALSVGDSPVNERIHPDVFINEYVQVNVKAITHSESTANITFDAASVVTGSDKKMKYDFGANVKAGSPLLQLAQQALDTNRPVYAAMETRRRYKKKSTQEVIPWTTPIHILRGCKDGPGSSANSNETGDNCSKVLAAIGFADDPQHTLVSDEVRSNPFKWAVSRDNQDGDLPPKGYVIPQGVNGEPVGGIIEAPAASQGVNVASDDVMAKLEALTKMVSHLQRTTSEDTGKKPWNEYLSNGQINPSSYAVSQVRRTREDAVRSINAVAPSDATAVQLREWESELTGQLLWVADAVQKKVTGQTDRMSKAHTEAGAWAAHVIKHENAFTAEMLTDLEVRREWAKQVRDAAAERYIEAIHLTQQASEVTTPHSAPQAEAQEVAQADAHNAPQEETQPATPSADNHTAPTFAQDTQAREQWDNLIAHLHMEEHVGDFNPALTARFGTHLAAEIPAAAMRQALTEWCADPVAFKQWAEQQYIHAANGQGVLPASA